ncbi:hypothetical protein DICPUDRAFT_150160 [Dictyostelium purpureum]|uniref:C2 domain-containing protein n=1 Tax=Dictyostelium purpureum TaxID=5786 RepID=F0ZFL4_DICPU|nr:uncharacterized protein DICPUDRAFT_150160 [Dictyostelium purpureum]EGC37249.1 hypothetical protein DICPUDRAFT_150160 [Dictyostelium purpureum]|eukprot:XP_003286219.1 hypothetical protein DICPUDRAFT_150160 [Dictyostelium purpureum]
MISPQQPQTKIELSIKCSSLKNKDLVSKSDPRVYVYSKEVTGMALVGKTETIKNNLNPEFKEIISIDYHFEKLQALEFIVVDIDKEIKGFNDIDENDTIGRLSTTLGDIISRPSRIMVNEIKYNGKKTGMIQISANEVYNSFHNIILKLEGHNLDKKDLFSSDPYFYILKENSTGYVRVFESEVIMNTLNPCFAPINLPLSDFNSNDMFKGIRFEFYDYDKASKHDFIGSFDTTTDELLQGAKREFQLINPKKTSKSGYKNSGVIKFYEARVAPAPTFLDYLNGGCEINLTVAIDCTASNGILHSTVDMAANQYFQSISAVGSVLAPYDFDGMIDVLGFGGYHSSLDGGKTSHCFPFSLNPGVKQAVGVKGVLDMYVTNIENIGFSFPTNFEEVIKYANKKATKFGKSNEQRYSILLILTDGDISDQKETISAIVEASKAPLSVIIVGVGSSGFSQMNVLDGDDGVLVDSDGHKAKRDIVQFVPFSNYAADPYQLACEVLKEIPHQFMVYMKHEKISPLPPRPFLPPTVYN